jgi:two-component system response regulator MprA
VRILLVEDDPLLSDSTARALRSQGWVVDCTDRGEPVAVSVRQDPYDLLILDVGLVGIDGFETLRRVRGQGSDLPVLMLTARDAIRDRVAGLDAGADDYLVKPFALEELLARLRALLRRSSDLPETGPLQFADIWLDPDTRVVRRGEREIETTRTEYLLLELFMRNPRRVLTRSTIFEAVWGYDFGYASNSLDVYIGYLRRKTEADGEPRLIHTRRGVGYVLREP